METLVENRVWLDVSQPDVSPEVLAFFSDGTLMNGTCGGAFRLTAWRWVDEAVLVWDSGDGQGTRAEVGSVGPLGLDLIIDPQGEGRSRSFAAARPPVKCD